jgi:hypothetical protein
MKLNAKEKANELVGKMVATYEITSDFCYDSTAKQCALIAVNEVLDKDGYNNDYWQEVKQEIEQL